jgi:plasmid stabilization system protein ParE
MEIVWTSKAEISYNHNIVYWAERNGSTTYSEKIISAVEEIEKEIQTNPYSGKYKERIGLYERSILNKRFFIFYNIREELDIIEIIYFRGAKQQPLEEVLNR